MIRLAHGLAEQHLSDAGRHVSHAGSHLGTDAGLLGLGAVGPLGLEHLGHVVLGATQQDLTGLDQPVVTEHVMDQVKQRGGVAGVHHLVGLFNQLSVLPVSYRLDELGSHGTGFLLESRRVVQASHGGAGTQLLGGESKGIVDGDGSLLVLHGCTSFLFVG